VTAEDRAIKNLKASTWQHPAVGRGWDMLWPESGIAMPRFYYSTMYWQRRDGR